MRFWTALRDLLTHVEDQLSVWASLELGISAGAVLKGMSLRGEKPHSQVARELLGSDFEGRILWEGWHGREDDYYMECARRVAGLTWEQVVQICGCGALALETAAREALVALTMKAATLRPTVKHLTYSVHGEGTVALGTYSAYNPLIVPKELPYFLGYFDGSPVEETLERIRADHHIEFDIGLLERLVDFGVLTAASVGKEEAEVSRSA